LAGADGDSGTDELSDGGAKWNESVKNVKGGLGLVNAAAADAGEHMHYEYGHDQAGKRRNREEPPIMVLRQRAKQGKVRPVNGKAETDYRQAGEDSDEDTQDQKKYFFVEDAFDRSEQPSRSLPSHHGARRGSRGKIDDWRGIAH
jgi:hypothetical protein